MYLNCRHSGKFISKDYKQFRIILKFNQTINYSQYVDTLFESTKNQLFYQMYVLDHLQATTISNTVHRVNSERHNNN